MIPKEVFLSHSRKNRNKASNLASKLRSHGIPVWYSTTNIKGAQQWHDEIGKALRRCDWFIVLLSTQSIKSIWVKRELTYALNHSQYENHILPILIEDCDYEELSWTLGLFEMIDFRNTSNNGYIELFRTWGLGYDPN